MSKHEKLIDELSSLTILEVADLVKQLEEKWGVTASAPVVAVASGAPQAQGPAEKTEFDVVLKSPGANKINVIKEVKAITGKELKDAKDLVDKAPTTIKAGATKDDAEKLKAQLEAAGAEVELK